MTDGRNQRAVRSKAAIINAARRAMLGGNFRPSMAQVAISAGVSVRSVFEHYGDVETMRREALDDGTKRSVLEQIIGPNVSMEQWPYWSRIVLAAVLGRAP